MPFIMNPKVIVKYLKINCTVAKIVSGIVWSGLVTNHNKRPCLTQGLNGKA